MEDQSISKQSWKVILSVVLSATFYYAFAYDLVRTDHIKLITLYAAVFFFYINIIRTQKVNFTLLAVLSVLLRLVFLFATPNLSQDFYRFIWDGQMMRNGFNPYLSTPLSYDVNGYLPFYKADQLLQGMGELNSSHFTNYPPVNQFIFYIASYFNNLSLLSSVFVLRIFVILPDIGTIYFGRKLLRHLNLEENKIFWFILNPLVIIELTGNLHFEGVMIFFMLWSLYLLYREKWFWSAVILALSISTKLIPLMFLPLLVIWFYRNNENSKKARLWHLFRYYLLVGVSTLVIFLPFYSSEFINNYSETVGLWFQKFEFNASLYYIIRELGFAYSGYNMIAQIGPFLAICVVLFIFALSFFGKLKQKKDLITFMFLALSFYLFSTTTVHPWYLATPIALSVFTNYKFPIFWSATVILSYLAYKTSGFSEKPLILVVEYSLVFGMLFWEIRMNNKKVTTP
ncbi:Protein of unknown function [Flavobacteriaceae bacterium MAR_2010_188]|nr:Protein of unknown function [Flavobacteriaceae bacterium MAR_2010_188]